jgi:hypothetical protein
MIIIFDYHCKIIIILNQLINDNDIIIITDFKRIFSDAGYAARRTLRARERRNCVIIGLSVPYTVLQAILYVSSP